MSDMQKFKELGQKPYAEQAKWFLNAFWEEVESNKNDIWTYTHDMIELDEKNGKEGSELEELIAHRFLEKRGETLTVREMRDLLRKIDIDSNKNLSLSEYLVFRYKAADPQALPDLVNSLQGNKEAVAEAQRLLEAALAALAEASREADEARQADAEAQAALRAAEAAEAEAVAAENRCRELEAPLKAAEEEVRAAKAELQAQEEAYNSKKTELEDKSENGPGLVSRNKAKNELQQLLAEDPLPLRRAQTTTEAALRKAEKARAPFKAATESAEKVRADAVAAKQASDEAAAHAAQQRAEAEAAQAHAEASFREAEEYLEVAKKSVPNGAIWWMEHELEEAKKFLPQSKGGRSK